MPLLSFHLSCAPIYRPIMTYSSAPAIWQSSMAIENQLFIVTECFRYCPLKPTLYNKDVQLPRLTTERYTSSSVYTLRVRACVLMNVDEYGVCDALLICSICCFICVLSVSGFLSTQLNMHHICQCKWWLWGAPVDPVDWEIMRRNPILNKVGTMVMHHDAWI